MNSSVFDLQFYFFNGHAIPPLVVGILCAALGIAVLIRERGSMVSISFCTLTWNVAIWLIGYFFIYSSVNEPTAHLWAVVANSAVVFTPTTVYTFSLSAVGKFRKYRIYAWGAGVISFLYFLSVTATNWFCGEMYHYYWGYYSNFSTFSLSFLFFFVAIMMTSLRLFWVSYRKAVVNTRRERLKTFLIGFSIGYLASVDYLATYGVPVYPIGYVMVFIFLIMMAKGIWRYHLVDITPSFAAEQIIKTMADTVLVIDRDGIIQVANDKAIELFGRPGVKFEGSPVNVIGIDFFRKENLARLIWTGSVQNHEITYEHPENGKRVIELSTSVIRDALGRGIAIVCIAKDITVRKSADEALRESERRYRLLAENVTDVIWTMDMNLKFKYISPSVMKLRGYTVEEALVQSLEKTLSPASLKGMMSLLAEELENEQKVPKDFFRSRTIELEYTRKDQSTIWTEVQITFMRNAEGRATEILGVTRDITERKKIEEALQESEKCYAELIQQTVDPILTLDRLGYIQTVNPAGEIVLGFTQSELAGKHFSKSGILASESVPKSLREFTMTILGWQRPPFELNLIRKDQTRLIMETTARLLGHDRQTSRVQLVFRDVSERRGIGGAMEA